MTKSKSKNKKSQKEEDSSSCCCCCSCGPCCSCFGVACSVLPGIPCCLLGSVTYTFCGAAGACLGCLGLGGVPKKFAKCSGVYIPGHNLCGRMPCDCYGLGFKKEKDCKGVKKFIYDETCCSMKDLKDLKKLQGMAGSTLRSCIYWHASFCFF